MRSTFPFYRIPILSRAYCSGCLRPRKYISCAYNVGIHDKKFVQLLIRLHTHFRLLTPKITISAPILTSHHQSRPRYRRRCGCAPRRKKRRSESISSRCRSLGIGRVFFLPALPAHFMRGVSYWPLPPVAVAEQDNIVRYSSAWTRRVP